MKYAILSLVFGLYSYNLISQNYGNDWIQPNQTYIKIETTERGVHRILAGDFQSGGFDLSGIPADNFHLYFRGQEQAVYVEKKSNGELQRLEFFAERLDGKDDASLYRESTQGMRDPSAQAHPNISLFSDTSVFYLSWDKQPSNFRYQTHFNDSYSSFNPEPHFRYEALIQFEPDQAETSLILGGGGPYEPFHSLSPLYGIGEGYLGPLFGTGNPLSLDFETPYARTDIQMVEVSFRVFGRTRTRHHLSLSLNGNTANPVIDTTINTSSIYLKSYSRSVLPVNPLGPQSNLQLEGNIFQGDSHHLINASLTYNRRTNLDGASFMKVADWEKSVDAYFQLKNLDATDTVFVYDLVNRTRNVGLFAQDTGRVVIKGFSNKRDLFIASDRSILSPNISSVQFQDLSDPSQGKDLILITHKDLRQSAESYQSYRETNQLNSLQTKIVYVDDIYEEFGFGNPTPLAIQRFCNYALENWQVPPAYVLLWGNARNEIRDQPDNLVPTYGNPVSDHFFVSKLDALDRDSIIPQIPIGRVNIRNNQEGMNYLNKVIEYEQSADSSWIYKGVFLGGGAGVGEQNAIRSSLENFRSIYENGNALRSNNFCLIDSSADPNQLCYDEIDNGVGLIHFFGHATSNIQDIEIGEASDYQNFGRYPVMFAMGCNGGDFGGAWSFGERWIVEPNRGAIAYMGTSAASYLNPLRDLGKFMYRELYTGNHIRLGDAINTAIKTSFDSLRGVQYVNHALQFNLQGDPTLLWIADPGNNTSIDDESFEIALKVFPNPAKDRLTISYELEKSSEVRIRLLDMQARSLFEIEEKQSVGSQNHHISLADRKLPAGIYYVQIQLSGKSFTQKLILRR